MAEGLKADVSMADSELVSCCYRSLAAPDLSAGDLLDIVRDAQIRNAASGVTGALVVAGDRLLHWLEGPVDVIDRLMTRIGRDSRHGAVEVLARSPLARRRFQGWPLQLCCATGDGRFADLPGLVTLAPDLLPKGQPLPVERIAAALADTCAARRPGKVALFPFRPERRLGESAAVARLGDLLLTDPLSRLPEIEALLRLHAPTAADFARIYERCAERIRRDLDEDRISVLRVTPALSALQMVLRRIHHQPDPGKGHGAVTVTAVPGENAILAAALAAEVLRAAGWSTAVLHPGSGRELVARLAVTRTATLVVVPGLVDGAAQEAGIARLIAGVRAASDLPAQRVLVGGRLARRGTAALAAAGADAGFRHLADLPESVARLACPGNADCCSMRACRLPNLACDKRINPDFVLANVIPGVLSRISARPDRRRSA